MKILQILPELNFGGVEIGTIDLAKTLAKRGHQPYVMSAGGELVEELKKVGIPHFTLPVNKKSLASFSLISKVEEIILREKIDIVHARSRIPAWIAYFATRKTDARFITTCHGYYSNHLMSKIMGWGERVIVISNSVGRRMIEDFEVPQDRIRLIHRGLDIDKYPFDLSRFQNTQKRKDRFIITNVARITPLKGHQSFLKAVRILKHHYPQIEVWLVGGYGRKKKFYLELLALIEKLGLKDTVKFLGPQKDIPSILKKSDLLVLSTTVPEGFGRVLIEAGAVGLPVVSTAVGGVLDVIEDQKQGYLVPPNDPDKLYQVLSKGMSDYESLESMAKSFRKKIEQKFTLDVLATKTIKVYEEVKSKKKILIHKLGALGDVILIVPSIRALRSRYPRAFIAVLIDRKLAPILETCPYVDELIIFDRKKKNFFPRFLKLVKKIRKQEFNLSIDFQNNKWTHLCSYLAGIRKRYGYKRGLFGGCLTNGLKDFKKVLPPLEHQLKVLNLLGIQRMNTTLELWEKEEDTFQAKELLKEVWVSEGQPLVGFVLNASIRWKTKNWSLEKFDELAIKLEKDLDARIVLIGDASNKAVAEKFMIQTDSGAVNLVGKTKLRELIALMRLLDCIVSGDTAPIHVATAVLTPAVIFFGPTDHRRHAPPSKMNVIMKGNAECVPCYRTKCHHSKAKNKEPFCLAEISVEDVYLEVKKILEQKITKKTVV